MNRLARLLLGWAIACSISVPLVHADDGGCPQPPPFARVEEPALVISLADTRREVREGEWFSIAGSIAWANGRPVWGVSPENQARLASGEPIVDDCRFEGGIVTLSLHFPLAPDYQARAVDRFVWTVVDWRGAFVVSVVVPWIVAPGEERVTVDGLLTFTACDRQAQQRGVLACTHVRTPFVLEVVAGDSWQTLGGEE